MSTRHLATALLVLVSCCDGPTPSSVPDSIGQSTEPSRVPELATSVVGSSPTPGVSSHPPSAVLERSPQPQASRVAKTRVVTGVASTYGEGYEGLFALPKSLGGRGERVRICNTGTRRCLVRTSNDVGPIARLRRVADLDATDFEYLCRCKWEVKGTMKVRITWLP